MPTPPGITVNGTYSTEYLTCHVIDVKLQHNGTIALSIGSITRSLLTTTEEGAV